MQQETTLNVVKATRRNLVTCLFRDLGIGHQAPQEQVCSTGHVLSVPVLKIITVGHIYFGSKFLYDNIEPQNQQKIQQYLCCPVSNYIPYYTTNLKKKKKDVNTSRNLLLCVTNINSQLLIFVPIEVKLLLSMFSAVFVGLIIYIEAQQLKLHTARPCSTIAHCVSVFFSYIR